MSDLAVERHGYVAVVTLDRAPVNAVTRATLADIRDAFGRFVEDRDVRAVVFTAAGDRAFMAGLDLSTADDDRGDDAPSQVIDPQRIARDAMWSITDCPVPVIGAINGPALGAGLAFAACCDILIASNQATFGTTEINVGLLGASAHLSILVGRHKAREMYFTGEKVSAAELYRVGAIRAVVASDELISTALSLAATIAEKSPIAMRLAKEAMNRVEGLPLKDAYRIEQDYTARLLTFEDSGEARTALLEKRTAAWGWR